jgi:hypothetical protein
MNKLIQQISENCGPGTKWESIGNTPVSRDTIETAAEFISDQVALCNSVIDAIALPDGTIEVEISAEDDATNVYDVSGNTVELRQVA